MHVYRFVFSLVAALLICSTAHSREGWYGNLTAGPNVHIKTDEVRGDFPYGNEATTTVSFLHELDYGYSFEGPFTLGLGFEFDNYVDIEYKVDLKWSFLEGQTVQPYTYLDLHAASPTQP